MGKVRGLFDWLLGPVSRLCTLVMCVLTISHNNATQRQTQARKFLTSLMIKHHPEEVIATHTHGGSSEMEEEAAASLDSFEARCVACFLVLWFVVPSGMHMHVHTQPPFPVLVDQCRSSPPTTPRLCAQ